MATSNIDKQSFGQAGATMLKGVDQAVTNVDICAILIVNDAVFDSAGTDWPELSKAVDTTGDGALDDSVHSADTGAATVKSKEAFVTPTIWPAGITIYGQFSKVKLDSGAVLCYHAA